MHTEPLDIVPLWPLFLLSCLGSGLALEAGYRLGLWRNRSTAVEKESPVGAMVGSVLGLFAFMLAFTFGSAGNRYEARRQAVLDESNAIGTTYLRAQTMHEPQRTTSMKLLREYVDVRVRGATSGNIAEAAARSEAIQTELWREAQKEAASHPTPITALYLQSLNAMIDIHATRLQVNVTNRIPSAMWIGLFSLALLGMASVGYQAGIAATRRSPAMIMLILAFAGVLHLIVDLDRPGAGHIKVSQDSMTSLQSLINASPP